MSAGNVEPLKTLTVTVPYCEDCKAIITLNQAGVVLCGSLMVVDNTKSDPVDISNRVGEVGKRIAYHWKCFIRVFEKKIESSKKYNQKTIAFNYDADES